MSRVREPADHDTVDHGQEVGRDRDERSQGGRGTEPFFCKSCSRGPTADGDGSSQPQEAGSSN